MKAASATAAARGFVALLAGVTLAGVTMAACTGEPTAPGDRGGSLTTEAPTTADFEIQVASDETVAEITIEDAALWVTDDQATGPWAEARELFRQARRAWRAGDVERAAELAHEGRLILAEALIERRGTEGLDALESHVEIIIERLDEAADDYARAAALRDRLVDLLDEAGELRAAGELTGAAERLILALGIADRMHHRYEDASRDAEAYATRAVLAAERMLARAEGAIGPDAGPRVRHALAHARELTRRANAALERGAWRRAIVLSRRSIGWSLYALRIYLG